jgi:hypothetical protein
MVGLDDAGAIYPACYDMVPCRKIIGFFVIIFLVGKKTFPRIFCDAAGGWCDDWKNVWLIEFALDENDRHVATVMATIWA